MALSFETVETYDPTKFIIYDTSDWTGLGDAKIEILPPECETPEVLDLSKNLINTFTPDQFTEITTDYFPDGLYEITVRDIDTTQTLTKYYIRFTRILNKIDEKFVACLDECSYLTEDFRNTIYDLELYIDAANAHLRNELNDKAEYFFKTALKVSDNIAECKTCK